MGDVALVSGAGGALGQALVAGFLARGDSIIAIDRHGREEMPRVRREAVDLTAADEVEALWDRLEADGQLPRWLVNAAGGFLAGTVAESEPDGYRSMHEVNLTTAWWSCRAAARRMRPGGAIVNVGARSAVSGGAGSAAYSVAKAAVVRLTQVLAQELAERQIRVNAVLPSLIDTPANRTAMSPERMRDAVAPERIAAVVAFLCSEAAGPVSGMALSVGGRG